MYNLLYPGVNGSRSRVAWCRDVAGSEATFSERKFNCVTIDRFRPSKSVCRLGEARRIIAENEDVIRSRDDVEWQLTLWRERTPIGGKRFRPHERPRKRRQTEAGHGTIAIALRLVRKGGARILQAGQKSIWKCRLFSSSLPDRADTKFM